MGGGGIRAVALAPKVQAHLKLEGRCSGHAWICFYCFVFSNVFIKDLFPFMLGKCFSNSVTRTSVFVLFFFKTIDDMKAFCKKIKNKVNCLSLWLGLGYMRFKVCGHAGSLATVVRHLAWRGGCPPSECCSHEP